MDFIERLKLVILSLSLFALWGCGGIGHKTVVHDRFDYTGAIGDSWKQQMLVNMVKVRYGDTPVFLDVASVINQYSVESQVDLRLTWVNPVVQAGTNAQSTGGAIRYIDRPTITYMPLSGEKFTRSLMKPIPPTAVLSLIQGGYPIDLVLRICVHSINGIRNRFGGAARARSADPQFYPLLERLRKIQDSGAMGFRVQKTGEMEGVMMTVRSEPESPLEQERRLIAEALGLDPSAEEFQISYGSIARNNREIAILSRSMLEITINLASYIQVPASHVEERRVNPTMADDVVQGSPVPPLIRIHSSADKPGDAFIAVPYRNYWFWIDDRDLRSKALFTFLMFMFSLTETGGKEGAPIITVPAG